MADDKKPTEPRVEEHRKTAPSPPAPSPAARVEPRVEPRVEEPRTPAPAKKELSPAVVALLAVVRPLTRLARAQSHLHPMDPCAAHWAVLGDECELLIAAVGQELDTLETARRPARGQGGELPRSPGELSVESTRG
jgi:hypothetical protein